MDTAISAIIAAAIGGVLYRLRGGWFSNINRAIAARLEASGDTGWLYKTTSWLSRQRTQIMRVFFWALPTAGLIALLTPSGPWWLFPALAITVWASMALWGHGAHFAYNTKEYLEGNGTKTELLTEWWLPNVFGGIPDKTWKHDRVVAYNLAGMSFIGLVRNTTAIIPLAQINEWGAIIYALTGLLHGPLYWAGYRINGQGSTSEVLVGAVTWASIVLIFG